MASQLIPVPPLRVGHCPSRFSHGLFCFCPEKLPGEEAFIVF